MINPGDLISLAPSGPGKVADWSVAITPADPLVTASLVRAPPFAGANLLAAGADALAGAVSSAVGALPGGSTEPPTLITFDRNGYYGRLDVDAQIGLSGGGFTLVLQRALTTDYDRLAAAKAACDEKGVVLKATVSLGWTSNRGVLGLLGPPSKGLEDVGVFAITEITPAVEGVAYRITLRGQEAISYQLSQRRITKVESGNTPELAVEGALKQLGVTDGVVPPRAPAKDEKPVSLMLGQDGLTEIQRLGTLIEAAGKREGRKPFLVRNGILHVGVARAIPFEGKVIKVEVASGLINYAETKATPRDPKFDFAEKFAEGKLDAKPEMRKGFRLDLVGAPQIRPGDVVTFPRNKDPTSLMPVELAVSEDWSKAIELYVATVSHRIEPNAGFLTTVTGVEVELNGGKPTSIWDVPSEAPVKASTPKAQALDDGTPEGALSNSVSQAVGRATASFPRAEVAEVAEQVLATASETLPLSSKLVIGLSDGPATTRRSAINKLFRGNQGEVPNVPYVSPFAWGPFGLVLPRYPGTRVALIPIYGDGEDPLDIGALWHGPPDDSAARPTNTEVGDWWLKLPARIDVAIAQDVVEGPQTPPSDALATNDLTDAEGNRFIEVGQLIIRVGDKALKKGTERPEEGNAPAKAIVIEQKDGEALITIDADGKVTIKAKSVSVEAPDGDGKVTIKAKNVAVEISGTMDVKKA